MKRRGLSVLVAMLVGALGCKKDSDRRHDSPAPTGAESSAAPSLTEPSSLTETAPTKARPAADWLATIDGAGLRAWAKTMEPGHKRAKPSDMSKAAVADLEALVSPKLSQGKNHRLRWARVMNAERTSIAFSYGVTESDYGNTLGFAVAIDDGEHFGVHSQAKVEVTSYHDVNQWGFGADRDVDGDGQSDTVITYRYGAGGGGADYYGGLVLLGTRGGAIDVGVYAQDAEYSEGGYDKETVPAVLCWRTIEKRPTLLIATTTVDSYADKKTPELSYTAVASNELGQLEYVDLFAPILARGSRAEVVKKRRATGASKADAFAGEARDSVYDAIDCPDGPIIAPAPKGFLLLDEPRPSAPAGDALLFHLPGSGQGLRTTAKLGAPGDYQAKPPIPDKELSELAPGAARVEIVTEDGVILGGTLWSTGDEDQPTAILIHGLGFDRKTWWPVVRKLAEYYEPGPGAKEAPRSRVLSIDLRGHGDSLRTVAGGTLDSADFSDTDWRKAVLDIKAAVAFARSQKPPTSAIALVGAGFGGSLATTYAAGDKSIYRLAILSPRLVARGLDIEAAYRTLLERTADAPTGPTLLASEKDQEAAAFAKKLGTSLTTATRDTTGTNLLSEEPIRDEIYGVVVQDD